MSDFIVVPKGETFPNAGAMKVVQDDHGIVFMVPLGGGFIKRINPHMTVRQFLHDWDVVTERNTVVPKWRRGVAELDDLARLEGYFDGLNRGGETHWNGWSVPGFTIEQIKTGLDDCPDLDQMIKIEDGIVYEQGQDDDGNDCWVPTEHSVVETSDGPLDLYTVGGQGWCWFKYIDPSVEEA